MTLSKLKVGGVFAVAATIVLAVIWESAAQDGPPSAAQAQQEAATPAGMDPEAAKVWNSPQMVKARAWLDDYLSKSARVTPEEAAQYKTALEKLTAPQMKLWLLKFEHEEQQRQQQYQAFLQSQHVAVTHAMAMHQATQQALANISQGETAAAQESQRQLDVQQQRAAQMQQEKMAELNAPDIGGPGYGVGYTGLYPYGGWGGTHYHVHIYPEPR